MAGMRSGSGTEASLTEIPVWAIETLVPDAKDCHFTAIANGIVARASAGGQERSCVVGDERTGCYRLETMARMVTMLILDVARGA